MQIQDDLRGHDHHSFHPVRLWIVQPNDVSYRQIPGSKLVDRPYPSLRRLEITGRGLVVHGR